MAVNQTSAEYQTLIEHNDELVLAFKCDLISISGVFVAAGLIGLDHGSEARNPMFVEAKRAAELVSVIQNEVLRNQEKYQTFIDVLKREDQSHYGGVISHLQNTCQRLRNTFGGYPGNHDRTVEAEKPIGGVVQEKFSSDMTSDQFTLWLSNNPRIKQEHKPEIRIFADEKVSGAAFMDLTTLDLKELGLSMGFRKIIEGIISQLKRIPRISTDGLIEDEIDMPDDAHTDSDDAESDDILGQRMERIKEN